MPGSSTGKWVARAGSTGGGRTYRGQTPVNWYAGVILIVVLGVLSVVFARYEYQHPSSSANVPPTVGTVWHAALAIDVCGQMEAPLPASTNASTVGISTSGQGVVVIAPTTAAEAGDNATLGRFVLGYKGLELTSNSLRYPGQPLYTNGQTCPSGTPDHGKQGAVQTTTWPNFSTKTGTSVTSDPTELKLANAQLITVGYVPVGAALPKAPESTISALVASLSQTTTSTTTTSPVSPTPSSTPTTAAPTSPTTTKP